MTGTEATPLIDRRTFVGDLIAAIPDDTLIVTGLGSPSYDVFASGDRPTNFYLWGAMGGAIPVALGLALAQPDKPVAVVTGDGEQLMGIGSLATAAVQAPANLTIVVLDNGHFGETGMQRSHSGLGSDLTAVARGFGVIDAERVVAQDGARKLAAEIGSMSGLRFRQVMIDSTEPPRALPPRDGVANKNGFRKALGFPTF